MSCARSPIARYVNSSAATTLRPATTSRAEARKLRQGRATQAMLDRVDKLHPVGWRDLLDQLRFEGLLR